ncbi:hypothetical protein PAHAL_5G330400 [Panicum hallii]|uniref:Uncharacterized protein n=1 Tax=Panicum hallii TaxID=206008 RepID=A0A2T8IM17_9POAL|nr:uncharacterized protein LOC112894426 [Panicum hallii]PVH38699.1 hypothetical protein PAHAL_5G330400 [Panicum hallii]
MCESVCLLAASNRDGHHHEGKKTTEMNTDTGDHSHFQEGDGADEHELLQDDGPDEHERLQDDTPPAEELAPFAGGSRAAKVAEFARQKLAEVNMPRAVIAGLGLVGGAVGVYFLWPAAAVVAAVGATMKAPGGAGLLISRVAFQANPQLYYQILRTAGAAAAAAAFAL